MALEPEWEATFEPNSYGFRPGRGCHDAIQAIFNSIKHSPKWVLDADIAKCFDKINHQYLLNKLNTTSRIRRIIRGWLKAGVMDRGVLQRTEAGTPQGGVISPLLANIALHGLEEKAKEQVKQTINQRSQLTIVRYADDFVIIHPDRNTIDRIKAVVEEWLAKIGLELKAEKTRISHTLHEKNPGFDFLGFNIRQYEVGKHRSGKDTHGKTLGFKTLIKPSNKSIEVQKTKIREVVKRHRAAPTAALINKLNPIIQGWSNYFKTEASSKTFKDMDDYLWNLLWRRARRRHPRKNRQWIARKYWETQGGNNWVFSGKTKDGTTIHLLDRSSTKIVRHVKVKGTASPMDGNLVYWSKRLRKSPDVSTRVINLLKRQNGKCEHCGLTFREGDKWEVDHIQPISLGGKDWYTNLQLLHDYCHDIKSAKDGSRTGSTWTQDIETEEPDEVKVSRPVLKTSREGDLLA